mgnify:CR=1 FL=1
MTITRNEYLRNRAYLRLRALTETIENLEPTSEIQKEVFDFYADTFRRVLSGELEAKDLGKAMGLVAPNSRPPERMRDCAIAFEYLELRKKNVSPSDAYRHLEQEWGVSDSVIEKALKKHTKSAKELLENESKLQNTPLEYWDAIGPISAFWLYGGIDRMKEKSRRQNKK